MISLVRRAWYLFLALPLIAACTAAVVATGIGGSGFIAVGVITGFGSVFVNGVESEHSLLAATKGVYGEAAGEWTPADALGYARVLSLPGTLQTRAGGG